MRRSFVLLVTPVVVAAAVSGIPSAFAASHSQRIVCPLEPSSYIVTCCPPLTIQPITCCVPTSAQCVAGVSIGSSKNPSTARHSVTVSGRLVTGTAGTTVVLWQAVTGGTFKQVAQTTTDSSEDYQFVRPHVNTNRQWYVTAGAARSTTISQSVRAVVTLTRSLRVHVSPDHSGQRVLIERRTKHGWKLTLRPRLQGGSSLSLKVAVRRGRSVKLRAVLPADNRNVESFSKPIRITG